MIRTSLSSCPRSQIVSRLAKRWRLITRRSSPNSSRTWSRRLTGSAAANSSLRRRRGLVPVLTRRERTLEVLQHRRCPRDRGPAARSSADQLVGTRDTEARKTSHRRSTDQANLSDFTWPNVRHSAACRRELKRAATIRIPLPLVSRAPLSGSTVTPMRTFVLIPGAGGSAWVWSRVTPFLIEAGHDAIAVELPGDDDTAGLPRYTELVVDAIGSRADVVLVAGSLGGFTAPLVCERVPVRELVLVNAMIPDPGETRGRLVGAHRRARGPGRGRPGRRLWTLR